jgi:site-specific recombinase XerD
MVEDMTIRKLGPKTQAGYIRAVKNFSAFLGHAPDRASIEDIRRYQLSLASSGLGVPSVNAAMTALRFFFKVTLRRGDVTEDIVFAHGPRRLPVVLSPDEVARLLAAAPQPRGTELHGELKERGCRRIHCRPRCTIRRRPRSESVGRRMRRSR